MSNFTQQINYKNTALLDIKTFKLITGLDSNIDDSVIIPSVMVVQDTHLQPLIGTNLLEEIKKRNYGR